MTCVCEIDFLAGRERVDHCWSCHRDQPRRGYIRCFECGHTYRTRWHLLGAYRHRRWRSRHFGQGGIPDISPWAAFFRGWWRPSRISFCQCCIHDF